MPSSDRSSRSGSRSVARLARQAEVLEEVPAHRERGGAGHAVALVSDEDGRLVGRPDDEQRLLEPRVEAGQVGEVGAVLAVRVHQHAVQAGGIGPLAQPPHAGRRRSRPGAPACASGIPKSGRTMSARRALAGDGAQLRGPSARSRPFDPRTSSASIVCQRSPRRPAMCTRTSARCEGPMPTWVQPALR